MKRSGLTCALATILVATGVTGASAERPIFSEDFGTSDSSIDASKWQATHAGMPGIQWPDGNPKDGHAAGNPKRQFVTTSEYGQGPVSVEFDLTVWNVGRDGYNLFGFVSPDSIWHSQNGIGWKISAEAGKVYAQSYTTRREGDVPGWHEHWGDAAEIPARAKLRIAWKPGAWAAFYLNGELKQTMTLDIARVPLRFGTDVQSTSWAIDDVKISLLDAHEDHAISARIARAAGNEFPDFCKSIGFDPNAEGAFYFIQITDTHIGPRTFPAHSENFRAFTHEASKLRPRPAFVAITGDLTVDGAKDEWRAFEQLVKKLERSAGVPVHMTLGNHDRRPEIFLDLFPDRKLHHSFDRGGVRFIGLHPYPDSSEPKDALSYCGLGVEQTSWLRDRVVEFTGKTVVIFVHHPLLSGDFTTNDLILDVQSALKNVKPTTEVWMISGHRHDDVLLRVALDGNVMVNNVITHDLDSLRSAMRFRCFFVQDGRIFRTAIKRLDKPIKLDPPPTAWEEHRAFYPPTQPVLLFVNVPDDEEYLIEERNCVTARGWRDVRGAEGRLVYRVPLRAGTTHLGAYAVWEYQIELSGDGKAWRRVTGSTDPERPYECKMPAEWGRYYKLALPLPEDLTKGRTLFIRFTDPTPGDQHWLGMESAVDWFCLLGTR